MKYPPVDGYDTTAPVYVYTRTQLWIHDIWVWAQGALFGASFAVMAYLLFWPKKG